MNDCISRAKLIKAIEKTDWEAGIDESLARDIATHIDSADTQEIKWVSVKERLPEEKNEKYWICTDAGYQCECRWTNVNPFWSHLETDWHWNVMDIPQYSKVAAWMPLPKPYTEAQ